MRFLATFILGAFLATSVFSAALAEEKKAPTTPTKPAATAPKSSCTCPAKTKADACTCCKKPGAQCKCPKKPATKTTTK